MLSCWKFLGIFALVVGLEALPKEYYVGRNLPTPREVDQNIIPSAYTLTITLKDDTSGKFEGKVVINLKLKENKKTITVNANGLIFEKDDVTVESADSATVAACTPDGNIYTIELDKELNKDNDVTLTISYTGTLRTEMDGFYISNYKDQDGNSHKMFSTHFESQAAEKAFPCFNDPSLKATFELTITHPTIYTAYSNTAGSSTTGAADPTTTITKFGVTPSMSTYLLAFVVADPKYFVCSPLATVADGVDTQVCGIGVQTDINAASNQVKTTTENILNKMKDFTGIPYSGLASEITVLTHAAIPEFAAGAMENWGLVTYREAALLSDDESSAYDLQRIQATIVHELSHQWFGDYMTLDKWSDIFLNEGFATYFEYNAGVEDMTDYEMEKQFVVDEVQTALLSDSKDGNSLVGNAGFNDIAYNKGGAVLRMVEKFLGVVEEKSLFKEALKAYVTSRAEDEPKGLATVAKLTKAINDQAAKMSVPVGDNVDIMKNWFETPGYPTVKVDKDEKNYTITQDGKWVIPITYSTKNETVSTDTKIWLSDAVKTVPIEESKFIVLNLMQSGYYRVDYSDDLLESLIASKSDIDEISISQIVDDQLFFARSGAKNFAKVFPSLDKFLINDTSYYTWTAAFRTFDFLLKHVSDEKVMKALKAHILELSEVVITEVQKTDLTKASQIEKLRLNLVQSWACSLGNEACTNKSIDEFAAFKANPDTNKPNKDERAFVYCSALQNSKDAKKDFDFLYNIYLTSKSATEKMTVIKALGCVNTPEQRKTYLENILLNSDKKEIKPQDFRYVFESVYKNNGEDGVTEVISFVVDNKDKLNTLWSEDEVNSLLKTIAGFVTTEDQKNKLIEGNPDAETDANDSLDKVKKLETDLKALFKINSATNNTFYVFNLALVALIYFMFN